MKAVWALSKLVIKEIFRKKDFYVALILISVVLFYAARLQFYNVSNIVRYLMEIGLALVYLFSVILTVTLTARQYPSEIQNRTCHVLFAKPIRRGEFVTGKFLGCFLAGASCFTLFYGVFLFIVTLKSASFSAALSAQSYYLFLLNLMVVAAMTSALSYYFTASAAVSISIVTYLLISVYGPSLRESGGFLGTVFYFLLPHFEFFDLRQRFIHSWGPLSFELLGFLTLYAATYAVLFLLAGWLKLRKEYL